ncbi:MULTISPECIES: formate C-acetyltransferase [Dehalobacter]|jgi:formate C-acetyltransferase|uniref:Formate acetyltransferase n=2 Tax=Dehalobacter restrictus TaxID=55583 RepID=A0A857DI84_9FIRM|nr:MULTISPECIES: formate C-acetyltransferase [Dehalobacter]AHF09455.1 formate acetyltransferase [Dehalobacter restrictus DSM 9455]MCG1026000.1 formate C-acetyltransferase [Dehalobacter sp.]OCZ53203.1 formate C-acetyltransferase [Dehalobacter sp. TeCB1]QHA00045.1 formate C-acetyltransferase [Dehalobacter restrictus]
MMNNTGWENFKGGRWQQEIDVRDFIQANYQPYEGDETFLTEITNRTQHILEKLSRLQKLEKEFGGVLDIDTSTVSSLLSYAPGFLDKEKELIVGIQTNRPLKRGVNPFGGINMARKACKAYGYTMDEKIEREFFYKTTHNDGVFRVYTDEMKEARRSGVITGLPDAYGRGRIIGDYRRVALYGVDRLIAGKKEDKRKKGQLLMDMENIKVSEELYKQIDFLEKLKKMAELYGFDISQPAADFKEAVQWLYFGYLGAIKEQNGAAMSLGRVSTFLDIYAQRDIDQQRLTEQQVQEIIDDFIIKLRMARHLRTPEYNELFAGDPMWITEAIGGMGEDGRTLVTKMSYRFLHTLYNLGLAPEPNLTVLWSAVLPEAFKRYCAKVSIDTDSIQYENDDVMRPLYGDDYGIACCVSAMKIGKQMQYFGARCNLPKMLLMALNGGRDEITGKQVGPVSEGVKDSLLEYEDVMKRFAFYQGWLARLYVNTMNVIHYMHDQYAYEKLQMALHDTDVERFMAFGIAGLSVVADSLSAIRYAKVRAARNEKGLIQDFEIDGEYPRFGNDDDRVDSIAAELTEDFIGELRKTPAYRNAVHTLSVLTITSNVVYGKKTGATPDGRKKGEAFAPGANPMHNREANGALASLNSVSKLPYEACRDGISCTFSITPSTIGKNPEEQKSNLVAVLDGYFDMKAHHININVLNREQLIDAMEHPEHYPNLTIRVSGYAVNFNKLSRQQQQEVISRTYHERL